MTMHSHLMCVVQPNAITQIRTLDMPVHRQQPKPNGTIPVIQGQHTARRISSLSCDCAKTVEYCAIFS